MDEKLTYKRLYHRIRESTGLDVLTENVLQTIIENCFADVTSRGYREFNEEIYLAPPKKFQEPYTQEDYDYLEAKLAEEEPTFTKADILRYDFNNDNAITTEDLDTLSTWVGKQTYVDLDKGLFKIKIPDDYRKTLHLKVIVNNKVYRGERLALTDERVNSIVVEEWPKVVRSNFAYLDKDTIFYTKGEDMFIENRFRHKRPMEIRLGYDKRLIAPKQPTLKDYDKTVINVRREFEDALVLFGIFFLLQRYSKDTDRVQMALNNYKYYVEDLTYTLAYEDNYHDEDGTICLDRV
ncbi:MAG: hypothetical protein K6G38_06340 [Gammaproteobacteria bacterium]|nr:hypothetical protein [Gammaproteobacteria bacterium]